MTATVPLSVSRAVPGAVAGTEPTQEFFRYPRGHVVTAVDRPTLASILDGLTAAGVDLARVHVLVGADGRRRLDAAGTEHGPLARLHRRLVRALSSDSGNVLTLMDNALSAGAVLLAVPLRSERAGVSALLLAHGAPLTWTFRRWSVETAIS
jgi:hypothetical protein